MSAVEARPVPPPSLEEEVREPRPDALPSLCPYLATPGGNWRRASVDRDHRCTAVSPPVQLAPEKQRRLCLVESHVNCATYGAALAARSDPADRLSGHTRPIARMTPVVLDQGRFDVRIPQLRADRALGQAVLVGLLGIVFVAILFARPTGDSGAAGPLGAAPSGSAGLPSVAVAAVPTEVPASSTEAPAATVVPSATVEPSTASSTPRPTASPAPTVSSEPVTPGATYRVKSGDNLYSIAARFGTTTRVLIKLNNIADPSKLKVGQVLNLP